MTPYYEDEAAQLFHGDARAIVPTLSEYDHLITDPPYDEKTHTGARTTSSAPIGHLAGVLPIAFEPLSGLDDWVRLFQQRRWAVVCCSMEMLGHYQKAAGDLWIRSGFWSRPNGAPQFSGDRPGQPGEGLAIWHAGGAKRWHGGGKRAYYEYPVVKGPERVHETQKPLGLLREIVLDFTDPHDLILDPFAGSGTTGVAAKECGRRAILIEIDEARCAIAAKRLADAWLDERIVRLPSRRGKQGALDWAQESC